MPDDIKPTDVTNAYKTPPRPGQPGEHTQNRAGPSPRSPNRTGPHAPYEPADTEGFAAEKHAREGDRAPTPVINSQGEYEAALAEIQRLSAAPADSRKEARLNAIIAAAEAWDRGKGGEVAGDLEPDHSHGPEPVDGLNRPDDLSVSGLPFNLGKLNKT